jgi:hypothetical protein
MVIGFQMIRAAVRRKRYDVRKLLRSENCTMEGNEFNRQVAQSESFMMPLVAF